jgi:hypothetical protein
VVIDNLRYDQWKTFLKVSNYYKLEKKSLTLFFLRRPNMPKRYFLWFDTTGNGKTVSQYWKMIPKKVVKLYEAEFFISATKTIGLNIKEDYFKISRIWLLVKTGREF